MESVLSCPKSLELSDENRRVLDILKRELEESCKSFLFLKEPPSYEKICEGFKKQFDSYMACLSRDKNWDHIIEDKNKTGWPDKTLFLFLQNQGWDINSWDGIDEIGVEWESDESKGSVSMIPYVKYTEPVRRFIIELDIARLEETS